MSLPLPAALAVARSDRAYQVLIRVGSGSPVGETMECGNRDKAATPRNLGEALEVSPLCRKCAPGNWHFDASPGLRGRKKQPVIVPGYPCKGSLSSPIRRESARQTATLARGSQSNLFAEARCRLCMTDLRYCPSSHRCFPHDGGASHRALGTGHSAAQSAMARAMPSRARPGCERKSSKAGRACEVGGSPAPYRFQGVQSRDCSPWVRRHFGAVRIACREPSITRLDETPGRKTARERCCSSPHPDPSTSKWESPAVDSTAPAHDSGAQGRGGVM